MNRFVRTALLITLISILKDKGSWAGETHIQKATYFLQSLFNIPFNYQFILYKHGPYAFDLTEEIVEMRADGFASLQAQPFPYGPSLAVESLGTDLVSKFKSDISKFYSAVEFVAKKFGGKRVAELERISTALYVTKEYQDIDSIESRADTIVRLKPHVNLNDATDAMKFVDNFINEANSQNLIRK